MIMNYFQVVAKKFGPPVIIYFSLVLIQVRNGKNKRRNLLLMRVLVDTVYFESENFTGLTLKQCAFQKPSRA